jgi:hypothetical protein
VGEGDARDRLTIRVHARQCTGAVERGSSQAFGEQPETPRDGEPGGAASYDCSPPSRSSEIRSTRRGVE